jgi:capsule polysaccharide export protein KpsC/LpsZ
VELIGRKSQVAAEFILMISLAMIVLMVLILVLYYLFYDYSEEKSINKLTELGYSLQSEFILAAEVEPGYERSIILPPDVEGANYSIRISNDDIVITYRENEPSKKTDLLFTIPEVTGTIATKGVHTLRTAANSIIIN